jgi:hypothetical protein
VFRVAADRVTELPDQCLPRLEPDDVIEGRVISTSSARVASVFVGFGYEQRGFFSMQKYDAVALTGPDGTFRFVPWIKKPHGVSVRGAGNEVLASVASVQPGARGIELVVP